MMRFDCLPLVSFLVMVLGVRESLAAEPLHSLRQVEKEPNAAPPSIYDCLQLAVGDDCRSGFDGQCVWCAEPIYGLCVTPSVADKIGMLPIFTCDPHQQKQGNDENNNNDVEELDAARVY